MNIRYEYQKKRRATALRQSAELAALYRGGKKLRELATLRGVTPQRVMQLLRRHGVTRKDRARDLAVLTREAALAEWRIRPYGIPRELYTSRRAEVRAFFAQRKNAKARGIPWEFTFEEWLSVWGQSGKLGLRGRKRGSCCMRRCRDEGAYSTANVYIATLGQNMGII